MVLAIITTNIMFIRLYPGRLLPRVHQVLAPLDPLDIRQTYTQAFLEAVESRLPWFWSLHPHARLKLRKIKV